MQGSNASISLSLWGYVRNVLLLWEICCTSNPFSPWIPPYTSSISVNKRKDIQNENKIYTKFVKPEHVLKRFFFLQFLGIKLECLKW